MIVRGEGVFCLSRRRGGPHGEDIIAVHEAAELLNVSRWTVYRWVQEGRLGGTKVGRGSLRIFYDSIAQLVQENQIERYGVVSGAIRQQTYR